MIRRGGDHLLGLIEGTLDIARIESGKFTLQPQPMRFAETVRELAHLFDPFAAVGSSTIQPLPHQIDAVYGRLLPLQPLRFLLADDPGAQTRPTVETRAA